MTSDVVEIKNYVLANAGTLLRSYVKGKVMMDENINNQRRNNRTRTNIKVVFFCDHFQYTGTATNCSESGMCINTSHCISPDSNIDIILPLHEELKLTGVINRVEKRENLSDVIGVELVSPPTNYVDFVKNFNINK